MTVSLLVVDGAQTGRKFNFAEYETFTVGRSRKATFCVPGDRAFSRIQFLIEVSPPLCCLKNLSVTGGTFVNGQRVTKAILRDGDIISGGRETKIQVHIELSGAKTETVERPCTAAIGSAVSTPGKAEGAQALPSLPGTRC